MEICSYVTFMIYVRHVQYIQSIVSVGVNLSMFSKKFMSVLCSPLVLFRIVAKQVPYTPIPYLIPQWKTHLSAWALMGLNNILCMRFKYYTKETQQGCSSLSNWSSLRRLWPWINLLPPVWLSTFSLRLYLKWYTDIVESERDFSCFFAFIHVLYITQLLPIIFHLNLIYSQIAFLMLNTLYWHFP